MGAVASAYGCSTSEGNHPPVLGGASGSGSGGGAGSSSGASGSSSSGADGGSGSGSSSGSDSGTGTSSDAADGSGGSSDSGSSSGSDAGNCVSASGCNMLQVCGARVNVANNPGTFPTPAGGTLVPGTYVLTGVDDYGSGLVSWERAVIQLTSGGPDAGAQTLQYAAAEETEAEAGSAQSSAGALTLAGTGFSIEYSCPSGMPVYAAGYTATSTTLEVMSQPLVFTYTKM